LESLKAFRKSKQEKNKSRVIRNVRVEDDGMKYAVRLSNQIILVLYGV
jgi:hypothetical protein